MPRDFNTIHILVSLFLNLLNSDDFQLYHEMAYLDVLNYLQMLQFQDFKLSSPLFWLQLPHLPHIFMSTPLPWPILRPIPSSPRGLFSIPTWLRLAFFSTPSTSPLKHSSQDWLQWHCSFSYFPFWSVHLINSKPNFGLPQIILLFPLLYTEVLLGKPQNYGAGTSFPFEGPVSLSFIEFPLISWKSSPNLCNLHLKNSLSPGAPISFSVKGNTGYSSTSSNFNGRGITWGLVKNADSGSGLECLIMQMLPTEFWVASMSSKVI